MQSERSLFYNELAIASLTVGITSFIQLFGLEKGITAMVFGILAIRRIKADPSQGGKKLAIAGVVLGGAYTLLALMMLPHALEMIKGIMNTAQ